MALAGKLIDQVVREAVVPVVRAAGFTGSKRTWHRPSAESCAVVNVQASRSNFGSHGQFTINVAIDYPAVTRLARGAAEARPLEYECILRERIGALAGVDDLWWSVSPEVDIRTVEQEVREALKRHALPWLAHHDSVAVGYEALRRRADDRAAAAAAIVLGRLDEGHALVTAAVADPTNNHVYRSNLQIWWERVTDRPL